MLNRPASVDKTNRILEEARHVSKHEENHTNYSKY
jgi:hypothetical protein